MLVGYTQSDTYTDWAGAQFANTTTKEIVRDGDRIIHEKITENNRLENTTSVKNVKYTYDEKGASGMSVNNVSYYFVRNIFGDVTAIYDESRNKKAEYSYDAWGTCYMPVNVDGIGSLNPFRYRGYYFVSQIGLYCLTTRFYDYTTGRFLNADVPSVGIEYGFNVPEGCNLYSYCLNNPVKLTDGTGTSPWTDFWKSVGNWFSDHWVELVVGAAMIVGGAVVTTLTAGTGTGFWAAFGAASLTSLKATAISTVISAGVGGLVSVAGGGGFFDNFGDNLASGFMWGGIFAGGAQMLSVGFKIATQHGFKGFGSILSPDRLRGAKEIAKIASKGQSFYNTGGRLFGFGFGALDVGTKSLLHMHLWFTSAHLPFGTILAGILGGI